MIGCGKDTGGTGLELRFTECKEPEKDRREAASAERAFGAAIRFKYGKI